jgi:hypothetical protein
MLNPVYWMKILLDQHLNGVGSAPENLSIQEKVLLHNCRKNEYTIINKSSVGISTFLTSAFDLCYSKEIKIFCV